MRQFFLNQNNYIPFKLGGLIHIGCILFLVIGIYFIYINRNKIKNIEKKKAIKTSMFMIMLINMLVYYLDDVEIKIGDLLKAIMYANLLFVIMYLFNNVFGTNYIMSKQLPNHILKLFPFLNRINTPIIILEIAGLVVALIAYIPVYLKHKDSY